MTDKPKKVLSEAHKEALQRGREKHQMSKNEDTLTATETPEAAVYVDPYEKVNGWPVADGFWKTMLFPLPNEGNKHYPTSWIIGDHRPVTIYKGVPVIVPTAIMSNITDACSNMVPEDDLTIEQFPVRREAPHIPFPHSDPVPATKEEFIAFLASQKSKPTAMEIKRSKLRGI